MWHRFYMIGFHWHSHALLLSTSRALEGNPLLTVVLSSELLTNRISPPVTHFLGEKLCFLWNMTWVVDCKLLKFYFVCVGVDCYGIKSWLLCFRDCRKERKAFLWNAVQSGFLLLEIVWRKLERQYCGMLVLIGNCTSSIYVILGQLLTVVETVAVLILRVLNLHIT